MGRSLARDRRRKAKRTVKSGQGDRGDRVKRPAAKSTGKSAGKRVRGKR